MPQWILLGALFVFGLIFGSFANVVIWRFPRGESLSYPGSHCPACDTPVLWFDNIPVVSWLLLRAKCRACGSPISGRYPLVELSTAVLWLAAGLRFGLSLSMVATALFFYLLLLLAFIDWDTMRLPNPLVGLLLAIGLVGAAITQFSPAVATPLILWPGTGPLAQPLVLALVGACLGSGIVLLIGLVYRLVRHMRGFGTGDVKLLAAMGPYLGLYVLMALFIGTVLGAFYGLFSARRSGEGSQHKFPFGPFVAAGGVITVLFGPAIWAWYSMLAHL